MSPSEITVASVNVSEEKGTGKHAVPAITIDADGVVGDAHAGRWHRQVSLLSDELIQQFAARNNRPVQPGEFAENITTRGLDLDRVAVLDRFIIGDVELEATQIGKHCHGDTCAIFREVGDCIMPRHGIFCRVVRGGPVRPGDPLEFRPRPLRIRIITLSDRASRGEYEDRGGPRIRERLDAFLADKRWRPEIAGIVLPDDEMQLEHELETARDEGVDIVFTTGGTGVGPRDVTPDVVASLADRIIPGIMEHIRVKFGSENPNALLSRGVAATMARTQVYALPGSVRAVDEYLGEILPLVEHVLLMLHAIDAH